MPYRVLVIHQQAENSRDPICANALTATEEFISESIRWKGSVEGALVASAAHLIVIEPSAAPEEGLALFRQLGGVERRAPAMAVLHPESTEEVLDCAASTCDDFLIGPVRHREFRRRALRLVEHMGYDRESVASRLVAEMGCVRVVGQDPVFLAAMEKAARIATVDAPVLVTGETGTGKELCARAIHEMSARCSGPFIAVDCSVIPDHLFENEVFGHTRGAFTDAHRDQKGLVAMADGGTLLLDEIDSLSSAAQAKLLRFLQERTFRPLGAERSMRADVRVIVATNRDLEQCVNEKQFRADLFFRLNVLHLHLPPLRERRTDIVPLARFFLDSLPVPRGLKARTLSEGALRKLLSYDWPGNARELSNAIQRAALFAKGGEIRASDIQLPGIDREPSGRGTFQQERRRAIEAFERSFVEEMLRQHLGNVTRAAQAAGKERRAFGRLIKKYRIDRYAPGGWDSTDPLRVRDDPAPTHSFSRRLSNTAGQS